MNFSAEKKAIDELAYRLRQAKDGLSAERLRLEEANEFVLRSHEAQEVLQHLAQAIQQKAHRKISAVVSSCLAAVFPDDPYEFQISFDRKRGKTEAVLTLVRAGLVIDPISGAGGGVVDVAAFALRVACLCLHRPVLRRVIVVDEPFKNVSKEFLPNARAMLESLAKDLDLQIIMVTHIRELTIGKVVEI